MGGLLRQLTKRLRQPAPGRGSGLASGCADTERGEKVLDALEQIATARGVEMATVALARFGQQPTVTAPITLARTVEQLPALIAAQDLYVSDGELQTLTTASS